MRCRPFTILLALLFLCGCGSQVSSDEIPDDVPTGMTPVVSRVEPASGPAGSTISIFGMGFSYSYPNNIVVVGDAASSATGYSLVMPPTPTEIEEITAVVSADAPVGVNSIYVVVYDNVSNTDITFTVTP